MKPSLRQLFSTWGKYNPLDSHATCDFTRKCLYCLEEGEIEAPEFNEIHDDNHHGYFLDFDENDPNIFKQSYSDIENELQNVIYDLSLSYFCALIQYREVLLDGLKLVRFLKMINKDPDHPFNTTIHGLEQEEEQALKKIELFTTQETNFAKESKQKPQTTHIYNRHKNYVPRTVFINPKNLTDAIPFLKLKADAIQEKGQKVSDIQLGVVLQRLSFYREFAEYGHYPDFPHCPEIETVKQSDRHAFLVRKLNEQCRTANDQAIFATASADSIINIGCHIFPDKKEILEKRYPHP